MKGARAKALVLKCSIEMIKTEPLSFSRGISRTEMKDRFPRYVGFSLSTYGNRMRDLVKDGLMQRHDCPSKTREKRRFYPTILDENGLINHSRCWNCSAHEVKE